MEGRTCSSEAPSDEARESSDNQGIPLLGILYLGDLVIIPKLSPHQQGQ
jgi:hypothetical protein